MGTPDYVVETVYRVDDRQAVRAVGSTARAVEMGTAALESFGGMASGALASIESFAAGTIMGLGAAGVAGAVMGVKTGLVDVNAKLEDVSIGFATIFNMMGATSSFENGLTAAKGLMSEIRDDAAALPGEFGDFVQMAQTLAAPLIQAGKGLEDIRQLTRKTVVAAAAMGVEYQQASREMAMLLEGHAGGHNVLGMRLGITHSTQVNGKDFNKASEAERFDFISKALKKADDSLPAFQKSWAGLTSTMTDDAKRLLGAATLPLFEQIKGNLQHVNDFLESPRAMMWAERVGEGLGEAFDYMTGRVEWIGAHWAEISTDAKAWATAIYSAFERIEPIIVRIAKFIGKELQNPEKALHDYVALKISLAAMSNAGGIVRTGTSLAEMFGGSGAAAGAGGEAGAAAAAGGAMASTPAAIALVALAGAVDVTTRSAEGLTPVLGSMIEMGNWYWQGIKDHWASAGEGLMQGFKDLWEAVRPLIDALGTGLLIVVDALAVALDGLVQIFAGLASAIRWVTDKIGLSRAESYVAPNSPVELDLGTSVVMPRTHATDYDPDSSGISPEQQAKFDMEAMKILAKSKALGGSGKTTVNVNAPLTLLSDADPERLAIKVASHIGDKIRNPTRDYSFTSYLTS